jgi:hypothetical protein
VTFWSKEEEEKEAEEEEKLEGEREEGREGGPVEGEEAEEALRVWGILEVMREGST